MFDANEVTEPDGPAAAGVAAASAVLGTVASIPASLLSDDELASVTLGLEAARRLLDAAELACLAELDRRGSTEVAFGQRTVAWLAHEAKLPRAVAGSRVRTARKLASDLEPVGDALRDGVIGFDHAKVLAGAVNARNVDELVGVTGELCDAAGVTTFERWSAEVRGLADLLDADGGHDPAGDLPEPRLSVNRVGDVTTINGQLVGDGAQSTQAALDAIADELFRQYTKDAKHTGEPVPSRSRLLAEALVELCRRGLAVDRSTSKPPKTDATVVINALEPDRVTDTNGAELLAAGVLLCDPLLHPIITNFSSLPLSLGRLQHLAKPHQVRAVNLRDGGCVFPGCPCPPAWVDTHHADEWGHGGHTDVNRMCGLCRFHHRLAHHPHWQLHLDHDGWTRWTRPDGHTFWGQQHQRQRTGPIPDT